MIFSSSTPHNLPALTHNLLVCKFSDSIYRTARLALPKVQQWQKFEVSIFGRCQYLVDWV